VNINPATMNLNTHSLHCIEDEFLRDGYTSDTQILDLAVDPDNRCCAFLIFGRHLAIVPFLDKTKSHLESYTVPLRGFEDRLDNVSDMTFLYGYYEPTILFLYQPIPTTAGRFSSI
jgi:cleavage and polyadenylation specificity factor subunit 1